MSEFESKYMKSIKGSFDISDDLLQESILEKVSNYHYRDMVKSTDGSFGSIKITQNQLKDLISSIYLEVMP